MIRNMRHATMDTLAAVDNATIGVFAFIGADGRPRAIPVTRYVDAGTAVVSSTLVFTDHMAELRQLALHGTVRDGVFCVERRARPLDPGRLSTLSQLKTLRSLARQARKKRRVFER